MDPECVNLVGQIATASLDNFDLKLGRDASLNWSLGEAESAAAGSCALWENRNRKCTFGVYSQSREGVNLDIVRCGSFVSSACCTNSDLEVRDRPGRDRLDVNYEDRAGNFLDESKPARVAVGIPSKH